MGSSKKEKSVSAAPAVASKFSLLSNPKALDAKLSLLFSSSSGPIKSQKKYVMPGVQKQQNDVHMKGAVHEEEEEDQQNNEQLSSIDESIPSDDDEEEASETLSVTETAPPKRKRKRDEDDLEGTYMAKLAKEEAKEEAARQAERKVKRQKQDAKAKPGISDDEFVGDAQSADATGAAKANIDLLHVPKHETLLGPSEAPDVEKASRTVFLGNVSTTAITSKSDKTTLLHHLASFLPSLPTQDPPHKVESLRFRSIAFSSHVPKKAAFARGDLMATTTKSTNAYAVYSTNKAAREAALRLNGTMVLGRHLRVDEVAHPAQVDHKRCVFVGNLGFVDDDSQMKAAAAEADGQKKPKKTPPSDIEEGLWVEFGKCGAVESVRVVRDPKTRVGKGFAYVQFKDQNTVESALLHNDKKFPPLLPRKLRVTRAIKPSRTLSKLASSHSNSSSKNTHFSSNSAADRFAKPAPGAANKSSLQGRANRLLGRAGAANLRNERVSGANEVGLGERGIRKPEDFVFEGHRASSKQGGGGKKGAGKGKGKGKPKDRSARRGAEWKKGKGGD